MQQSGNWISCREILVWNYFCDSKYDTRATRPFDFEITRMI